MHSQGPSLKHGVDLQLQEAFYRENWLVASRLAEKRARTFNDQYYTIVKICAESKIDDPVAKFAAINAVRQYAKDGTVIKDVDAIDLLEWAAQDFMTESEFPDLIGALRVRAAKATPKDKIATTRCLQSCLLHWDLVSAQQIAALIDRSFPQERSFMFWNIVITHMLAISPQSPADKKKLFGMLAQKQIERAAQLTEGAATPKDVPARGIKTEEEILLLYQVVETHGSDEDFAKLVNSPAFSPVGQLQQGRKELLMRVVARYKRTANWQSLFDICHRCLSQTDDNGQPTMLASDWVIWREFIEAAGKLVDIQPEIQKSVQELLVKTVQSTNIKPIYKRNLQLARVAAAFALGPIDEEGDLANGTPSSRRLIELIHYMDVEAVSPACFDDIKGWVEQLDAPAMQYLAYDHLASSKSDKDDIDNTRKQLLALKLQYLISTIPLIKNNVSDDVQRARSLGTTFENVLELYTKACINKDNIKYGEISAELALLLSYCLLDMGEWESGVPQTPEAFKPLVQAAAILDHQLGVTPEHSQVSLVLVQVHLLLGSAHEAYLVWEPLAVKNTILDSLAPMLYDRLSTISPSILSTSDRLGRQLVYSIKSHFENALKLRMPRRLIDAFEASSYGSVLKIPEFMDRLRSGTTRVMSLIEEARAGRLLADSSCDVSSDPRFTELMDSDVLIQQIDYGSFPSWSCSSSRTIYERLRLGPILSNQRAHVGKLAEAFYDVLKYQPPSTYKAASPPGSDDFVLETISKIGNSIAKFPPFSTFNFTPAEIQHYELLTLLCALVPLAAERSAALPAMLPQLVEAATAALDTQQLFINNAPGEVWRKMSSFHEAAMLRDSAVAVKAACDWVHKFNEGKKLSDKSGQSNLSKETVAQFKTLAGAADAALKNGKAWAAQLKKDLAAQSKVTSDLKKWTVQGQRGEQIKQVVDDGAVARLVASWDKNVVGWQQVKWE